MEKFPADVWIVGGSARGAAGSALRAGLQPLCSDLFADADLQHFVPTLPAHPWPQALLPLSRQLAPRPWMYTGGLENYPDLIEALAQRHPLWGSPASAVRPARDPWRVSRALHRAGLPALKVYGQSPNDPGTPPADGQWIRKPLRGAGGRGVFRWNERTAAALATSPDEPLYYQQYAVGQPVSALFLAWPERTELLGISEQLIGISAVQATEFGWCGNIFPAAVGAACQRLIAETGRSVATECGLRGVFGGDFIIADDTPWLTEINPRYPGSAELLEYQLHIPLIDWHRQACNQFESASTGPPSHSAPCHQRFPRAGRPSPKSAVGKLILFSPRAALAADPTRFLPAEVSWRPPFVADLSPAGTPLSAGHPVCTLFATGQDRSQCYYKLLRRAARMESRLLLPR